MSAENCENGVSINDLPDEVLEYILSLVPPYKDLQDCKLVCKRWHRSVQSVIRHKKIDFLRSISNFNVKWQSSHQPSFPKLPAITKRYSHSACSHGNFMYVFGGCTCTSTTFNDLWKLDLSTRQWYRLLSMGSYPSPKACASLVYYKNSLVLFGGWTHPSPYPLLQPWRTFNELHIYDIEENRWSCIMSPSTPPPTLAGHSATVHGDCMIVFGGLRGVIGSSNEVWCLDLISHSWTRKETSEIKPSSRYGQSQIYVDDERLLIIGGWGMHPVAMMSDIWLLTMTGRVWNWTPLKIHNTHSAASNLWCHPACRVDNYVVVLSRNPLLSPPTANYKWSNYSWGSNQSRTIHWPRFHRNLSLPFGERYVEREREEGGRVALVDRDVNVNGRRGSLNGRGNPVRNVAAAAQPIPVKPHGLLAFRDDTNQNSLIIRRRERQLDLLRKMEDKLRGSKVHRKQTDSKVPKMAMFVLDISCITGVTLCSECSEASLCTSWLPVRAVPLGGPDATILHSLVPGHGELVMFGGMEKDLFNINPVIFSTSPDTQDNVSNSLHFISAPLPVI